MHCEYKSRPLAAERLARELAAMANSGGGILLLGVEDNGRICGCSLGKQAAMRLASAVAACITPPLSLQTGIAEFASGRVVAFETAGRLEPPYRVRDAAGEEHCPVRAGDRNQDASPLARRSMGRHGGRRGHNLPPVLERILREEGRITPEAYAGAGNLSRRRARRELVRLVREGRLGEYRDGPHTYFC